VTTLVDLRRGVDRARRAGRRALGAVRPAWFGLLAFALTTSDGRADVRDQTPQKSLEIRGSGFVLPLARRVAEAYMADHPGETVAVSSGGNRHGLKSLIVGTCEMAIAGTEVPEDLEKLASDMKVELVAADIYRDAVVVVVHPRNPVRDLSMKEIRDVFRGSITNWKELGGKDAPIVVTTHESVSGLFEIFKKAVLGDDAVITPRAVVVDRSDLEKGITEDAIGFAGLHGAGGLKVLTVGGVVANLETIASGRYPIRRTMRLYQRRPETSMGKAVLHEFLAADKGQAFVRAMGDVPVR
jgi:phosphate transport system substrate-binding protein